MGVSLGMALSIAKRKALQYGAVNIIDISMNDSNSALVFTLSNGSKNEVPIDNLNSDNSKVFIGEGDPNIKAKDSDLYIDKKNKKIWNYLDYKWNFVCEIGVSNTLIEDIKNFKDRIDKIEQKVSKLNISAKFI